MPSAACGRTTSLRRVLAVVVSLVLWTRAFAIGASGDERPPAPRQTPETLSRRLCDALQRLPETRKAECCGTNAAAGVAAECARELGLSLRAAALALDPADVDHCAAESARELQSCDWVTPYLPRLPASCRGIVRGRLQAGARCRSSLECRDGLHCRGSGPTVSGVCLPPGRPGAACGGIPDALATYARQTVDDSRHPECEGFCVRGRCTAFVSLGGACSADRQCVRSGHCVSGRCVDGPRPGLGESCAGSSCADELACVDGRCTQAKKAGEPCTHPFECEATCLSPASDKPGTCGMKCSAWPPAGYTPPALAPSDRTPGPY